MTKTVSGWRELSEPAKYRLYAQVTLLAAIASVTVFAGITVAGALWASATVAISGLASLAALLSRADLFAGSTPALRRWGLPVGAVALAVVWASCAIAAELTTDTSGVVAVRATGFAAALFAAQSIVPFVRHRWWVLLGMSVATGAVLGATTGKVVQLMALTGLISGVLLSSTLLTRWGLQIVEELERAKTVEARLQVAEERLRFARDLHDVVGRSFSAIAVKSELAATLAKVGAHDRARIEMDEVKTVAVESMNQMRALVRGYRDINLDGEVAGARSLLAAAGCRLAIEGDPSNVPTRFHEVSAWVVREGTTNIVKHSTATCATMTLGKAGMSLRNNGVLTSSHASRDQAQQTGLRGLAERLTSVDAGLDTTSNRDGFLLEVYWDTA
ncbi:histidine kinase [Rhodococcus sp. IEGM 1354]|uniref:sensor histidine kinase n=1 Tax=Rhodococcus sp. IEGM 1354 TaxID=3047088 RepID=UPI0024B7E5CE|nr:histidine kinase [Rhodococcus sp. IEGM 1354]MDI9930768.1 histidine kinase [Rhodococcus sp. IEGM 1354]